MRINNICTASHMGLHILDAGMCSHSCTILEDKDAVDRDVKRSIRKYNGVLCDIWTCSDVIKKTNGMCSVGIAGSWCVLAEYPASIMRKESSIIRDMDGHQNLTYFKWVHGMRFVIIHGVE